MLAKILQDLVKQRTLLNLFLKFNNTIQIILSLIPRTTEVYKKFLMDGTLLTETMVVATRKRINKPTSWSNCGAAADGTYAVMDTFGLGQGAISGENIDPFGYIASLQNIPQSTTGDLLTGQSYLFATTPALVILP